MEKVIVIRYGEIFLKGKNKKYFENLLVKNIENSLNGIKYKFTKSQSRNFITDFSESDYLEIIERLKKVFGIHSMSLAYMVKTDFNEICKTACSIAPENGSFRISVRRADKTIAKTSIEISSEIGDYVLSNKSKLTVDLHHPEYNISIDIRENNLTYIYFDTILGAEGMPVGCAGKGMLLLSGGIDSPVAGYRMARRGMQICGLHFHSYPFTSAQAKQKVVDLAKILTQYCGNIYLFVVPFTEIQQSIHDYCKEEFMITVMRRIMIKIAEKMAKHNKCGALITGESLGQVASQTLESITVTNDAINDIPILRPLISMDKIEIIEIAKNIGTYETSILPYEDCCTVFLPKNPIIKPKLNIATLEEAKIPNLEQLIENAIQNVELIKLKN